MKASVFFTITILIASVAASTIPGLEARSDLVGANVADSTLAQAPAISSFTDNFKRATDLTPGQLKEKILALPKLKLLPPKEVAFLKTVPAEIWASLRTLTPEQFTAAIADLEAARKPDLVKIRKDIPGKLSA
ncbi:hypothetical protein H072_10916 [Dactylellina haptotyla CBS 200.50]|uniref:Uncharacterized protein n=1 Tax=Dactylellina haptotyla (strain CBS 200.50) TaxID=1284197 RepID=S8B982_DACHA|nr:hypothetical protein H072_10916 [Dactylellina haptotyla CBS 200.50]